MWGFRLEAVDQGGIRAPSRRPCSSPPGAFVPGGAESPAMQVCVYRRGPGQVGGDHGHLGVRPVAVGPQAEGSRGPDPGSGPSPVTTEPRFWTRQTKPGPIHGSISDVKSTSVHQIDGQSEPGATGLGGCCGRRRLLSARRRGRRRLLRAPRSITRASAARSTGCRSDTKYRYADDRCDAPKSLVSSGYLDLCQLSHPPRSPCTGLRRTFRPGSFSGTSRAQPDAGPTAAALRGDAAG